MSTLIWSAISWPEGNVKLSWDEGRRSWFPEQMLKLQFGEQDAFSPWCFNWFRSGKKKQQNNSKHSQRFLAFCSKPKPKHLQAEKAIPASPPKKQKQWGAHRRAPMFHNPVGAAREVQSGLAQCGTVWSSCSHALVTAAPCHTPTQAPNPALAPIWGSERRKQQEMLQETNCKGTHHSCQPIRCAYRKPKASFQII